MFQSFDVQTDPTQAAPRVERLRSLMAEAGIDAFLVPRADEHQGEYVAPRSERLKWLTGFTGSAGCALVMADRAVIFVDGRYTLQVREQTDGAIFDYESLIDTPPHEWLETNAAKGWRIGMDPWLHTIDNVRKLREAVGKRGATLAPLDSNPVDRIWEDQPAPPLGPVELHPLEFAGEAAVDKLARLAATLSEAGATHCVLTDPSSLAWAFNIRGADVPHTPLALGFAILGADGAHEVFLDRRKLDDEVCKYLDNLARIEAPDSLTHRLAALASKGASIGLDERVAADKLRLVVEEAGGKVVAMTDPASIPRAVKNDTEIAGARAAHRRDGAAMARFLRWLEEETPAGEVDEIAAATRLEAFRVGTGEALGAPLRDISFDSVSGAGPNGAVIHYRVNTATNRRLGAGELYLVDSGGQYRDGTTDITRTVSIGEPSEEMRRHYTIVLKGLIAISVLKFPAGTRGQEIDAVARLGHWRAGIDYAHGTGHGVGSYLGVHEGPQRIARTGGHKLLAGMILSNEPGYYREGRYGIRLENLILVREASPVEGGEIDMHDFETLTLAPFDRRLIVAGMLEGWERRWLDDYHARVRAEIGPLLDEGTRDWLARATSPIDD